ncbi:MAG: hypothetical protein WKF96_00030 [Solirubrobacteraceae bacterium]
MSFRVGNVPVNRSHGHAGDGSAGRSPTYYSWQAMIARCVRPAHPRYEHYGGRGIRVDPRWVGRGGFARFLKDVGPRLEGMTLDRIDVNGHYTASNVRWAPLAVQRWNRRDMMEPAEPVSDEYHVVPAPWEVASC